MIGSRAPRDYPRDVELAAPNIVHTTAIDALRAAGLDVASDVAVRADHGRDWWPISLLDVAAGHVPSWPDAVVHARDETDVATTLRVCNEHHAPVTVQGGRSSVVGGAQPAPASVALDLRGLSQVSEPDVTSGLVRVGAGAFGPDLESHLAAFGLTVGHFPQSFEMSTVGGWLASRGAGQFSNRYGTAADLVRALRVVLADGRILDVGANAPRASMGPDLTQLFVGSEGTLGVIVSAILLARPRAQSDERRAFSVPGFSEGLEICRRILQRGASPAVLRLYDDIEAQRLFSQEGCVLLVLDEGDALMSRAVMQVVDEETSACEALDTALVAQWLEHRNDVAALADLWDRGVVVDTIETSGFWARLPALHDEMLSQLRDIEGTVMASVHQSHAYLDGACLYVTFAGVSEKPREYYRAVWDAAMHVAERHGALSHHHGIGRLRARHLPEALGEGFSLLEGIKNVLDPHGILNPGVLGLKGAS